MKETKNKMKQITKKSLKMEHKCKMPYKSKIIFRNKRVYNFISIKCHAEETQMTCYKKLYKHA